jgi:DNA-3-methyladenine glycosylase II
MMMQFSIRPNGPFHFDLTLQRYRLFGEDAAHPYADGVYTRVIDIGGQLWGLAIRATGTLEAPVILVQLLGGQAQEQHRLEAEAAVHWSLGLDVELEPFYHWAQADLILAELCKRCYGMRPPRAPALFEALITLISAQQVNLAFATSTRSRLIRRYGRSLSLDGRTLYAFPTAEVLADASLQELRNMQFSWRKAEYIVSLARLVATGELNLETLQQLPNAQIIACITQIKGLGRWTADWLLARGLGRGDVTAAGDLAVRRAISTFYFDGKIVSNDDVRDFAGRWGGYQCLVVHYLLAGLHLLPPQPQPFSPAVSQQARSA